MEIQKRIFQPKQNGGRTDGERGKTKWPPLSLSLRENPCQPVNFLFHFSTFHIFVIFVLSSAPVSIVKLIPFDFIYFFIDSIEFLNFCKFVATLLKRPVAFDFSFWGRCVQHHLSDGFHFFNWVLV